VTQYKTPPKKAFRAMGLGVEVNGYIKVVAGFRFRWWVPDWQGPIEPLFVQARILRRKNGPV
jgi:hypothetical protein